MPTVTQKPARPVEPTVVEQSRCRPQVLGDSRLLCLAEQRSLAQVYPISVGDQQIREYARIDSLVPAPGDLHVVVASELLAQDHFARFELQCPGADAAVEE